MTLTLVLEVVALILFILAAINVASDRLNLVAAGLACWVLAVIVGGLKLG